jgi:hypothetical protein
MDNFTLFTTDFIDEQYVNRIITNKIPENIALDYKRELKIGKGDERKEFLFDIAAFSNTEGGLLIFGIEEEKDNDGRNTGIPKDIVGLTISNIDALTLQIEDLVKSSIQPSLANLLIKLFEIDSKSILVIGVPKHYGLPHMVTYNSSNKFYKRNNSGKYLVDVFELNQMFMINNELQEKAKQFVRNRFQMINSGDFLTNLDTANSTFIHIIPLSFTQNQIRLTNNEDMNEINNLFRSSSSPITNYHNFEGYIMSSIIPSPPQINSYVQVFRNGIIESFSNDFHEKMNFENHTEYYIVDRFEIHCIELIQQALTYFSKKNIYSPILVFVSIFGLKNYKILTGSPYRYSKPINRISLIIPPILIKTNPCDIDSELKPIFDILWQSSGVQKSINYNDLGKRLKK